MELLLENGATVDSEDNDQDTPLHLAAQEGHDKVVDMFLGAGASVSSKDKNGWTPLHFAAKPNLI